MKIKIDADGFLHIWRGGEFKTQVCPHNRMVALGEDWDTNEYIEKFRICGDWCPLFGEPKPGDFFVLELCKKQYVVEKKDFTDERSNA